MKKLMHEQNRLWDYEVLKQLGKGEYGQVFQVRLKKDNKLYALKKINIAGIHQKQKIQAFRQIKALKLISHPDIIEYHDSFLSMDNIYIVTEFAEKGDLTVEIKNRIKKEKKFTEDELWDIFQTLVSAIKHLHEKNIIHRDLKIQNIFQMSDGKFKVGDLGMSKIVYDNTDMISTRVGTPIYFAPQIIQHKMYSFPVDIWALGCVFYYLAALEHPFKDATIQTLAYYIIDKDPKPIKGAYSPQLISFINSLFDKNPQTRPTIHDCFKKLKERKQHTVRNKVSIFNVKQILNLKAQHLEQLVKQQQKFEKKQQMSPKNENVSKLFYNRRNNQILFNQNPERRNNIASGVQLQKRNMSLYIPKQNSKIMAKSQQKQYQQECSSPMIKSNGFSISLGSPDKNKPGNKLKLIQTSRYPYLNSSTFNMDADMHIESPNKNSKGQKNNFSFSINQPQYESPRVKAEMRYKRPRARMDNA